MGCKCSVLLLDHFLCSWLNTSGFSMFLGDLQLILSYWCFKLNSEALCNLDFVCILFKIK